jgi:hypothetical protein
MRQPPALLDIRVRRHFSAFTATEGYIEREIYPLLLLCEAVSGQRAKPMAHDGPREGKTVCLSSELV